MLEDEPAQQAATLLHVVTPCALNEHASCAQAKRRCTKPHCVPNKFESTHNSKFQQHECSATFVDDNQSLRPMTSAELPQERAPKNVVPCLGAKHQIKD